MSPVERPSEPTRLKITDDKGFEKVVLIDRDVFPVGRTESAGLTIPDEENSPVSRRHAVIVRDGNDFVLRNESGSCGTRVNGRPVQRKVLKDGDVIRLGSSRFQIHFLVEGSRASDVLENRMRILLEVLLELHSCMNIREISARAVASVLKLLSPEWTTVSQVDGPGQEKLVVTSSGDASGSVPTEPTRIAHRVMSTARSYFQPDRICVAIPSRDGRLGVIEIGPRKTSPYSAHDLELMESLASHVGVALWNARHVQDLPALSMLDTRSA